MNIISEGAGSDLKHEKISIKWKIFIYLLSFSAVLLLLLWFFQTVYLDNFYKRIKKNELENAMENVVSVINDEEIETAIKTISDRYDICILITDENGKWIYSAENNMGCSLHKFSTDRLKELYEQAERQSGELELNITKKETSDGADMWRNEDFAGENIPEKMDRPDDMRWEQEESFDKRNKKDLEEKEQKDEKDFPDDTHRETDKYDKLPNMPKNNKSESIVKVKLITTSEGESYAVMLNSVITPVDATVHTLRIQLIYISVIMVLLSLVIAFFISKRVSKSIIGINDAAKELAKGNFDIEFAGKDYKEIAELSETLNHTTKELLKSDVLQKELIANVSHDLRTPLTMITAYAEVMRDLPGENTPENVQVIIDEANRLTILVNDLLDMSKIQAGVTKLETKEYDLTESIKSIIERHSKLLEPYGYQINFSYDENVLVNADEFKIYQVVYNLIGNAVNYVGDDKLVTVSQLVDKEKASVRIEVKDHGQGIPKEKLDSVWQRYYKVDKEHKRAIVGSGLGLSIVKNILVMHGAEYGVISEEGKGSIFWFELKTV